MWILWRTPFCRVSMRIRLGEPCGRPLVRGVHPVWTSPGAPRPALHRVDRSCPDSSPDPPLSCPHSCPQGTSTPVETREIMRFSAVEICGYMWTIE